MAKYEYTNAQGEVVKTIDLVLPPTRLTGVETDSTSNIITVDDTDGVWPGMAWNGPYVADGVHAWVRAVISGTKLEIWGARWNAATGFFEIGSELGKPTVTDDDAELIAQVSGFREFGLVVEPTGLWRNEIESTGVVNIPLTTMASTVALTTITRFPYTFDPKYTYAGGGAYNVNVSLPEVVRSDTMAAVPLQRHRGEPMWCYMLVSAGGYVSILPAAGMCCTFAGVDAADGP